MKTLNQIIKSKNDKLAYKAIQLENQLKCVLISDPLTEKCAAVMNVASGSFEDPREFQGLAHFLEHMLFLGSGKYPRPDQYREFVVNNGGSCNAYTDMANTVYYYTVKNGVSLKGVSGKLGPVLAVLR